MVWRPLYFGTIYEKTLRGVVFAEFKRNGRRFNYHRDISNLSSTVYVYANRNYAILYANSFHHLWIPPWLETRNMGHPNQYRFIFFIGQFFGLVFVFFAGTIGIVMGVLYKGDHALPAIIGGVITTLVNFIIGLTISSQLFGIDLVEQFKTLMRSSLETVKNMGSVLGSQEQINQTFEMYHRFIDMIDLILPVLLINSAIIIVLFNHFFAVKIMKRLDTPIPQLPPFREWRFPRSIVYYYILTMIALSIKSVYEINTLKIIVSNLYPILQMLLLAQGLSFLFFLAHMKGFKKGIPIIVSIVAILNPFLSQILIILGMVDLGFHLRNKLKV